MLQEVHIRNLAVIERLSLHVADRLTVLTGETGAGKSILIEALGLILGDRAQSVMVRSGADQAEVVALFDLSGHTALLGQLEKAGISLEDPTCIVKRQLNADGGSRAYINDLPVSLRTLQSIGEQMVDIHGQHAHQSLLRRDIQRTVVDAHARHAKLLDATAVAFDAWKRATSELQAVSGVDADLDTEIDLLRYQCQELQETVVESTELAHVEQEHRRLANLQTLTAACLEALNGLDDDQTSAAGRIAHSAEQLRRVTAFEPKLTPMVEMLAEAEVQIGEAVSQLRHYLTTLEASPEQLELVEERLATLHDLARKHRTEIQHLPQTLATLSQRLRDIEGREERIAGLNAAQEKALRAYRKSALALHKSRTRGAKSLAGKVTTNMQQLGMAGGAFSISITHGEDATPTSSGDDRIEFLITTNPGQSARPLSKVASGGELSRIGLAIQVVAAQGVATSTLIFDEVDAGIGGGIAECVGKQLRALSAGRQVLCVTHLPQVAAQGHHHLQVAKSTQNGQVQTEVIPLQQDQRIEEIARMLGGLEITAQTRAHAKEMLGDN